MLEATRHTLNMLWRFVLRVSLLIILCGHLLAIYTNAEETKGTEDLPESFKALVDGNDNYYLVAVWAWNPELTAAIQAKFRVEEKPPTEPEEAETKSRKKRSPLLLGMNHWDVPERFSYEEDNSGIGQEGGMDETLAAEDEWMRPRPMRRSILKKLIRMNKKRFTRIVRSGQ